LFHASADLLRQSLSSIAIILEKQIAWTPHLATSRHDISGAGQGIRLVNDRLRLALPKCG
jgi:hypothetical protein